MYCYNYLRLNDKTKKGVVSKSCQWSTTGLHTPCSYA